jgi:fumarylacetoacetase
VAIGEHVLDLAEVAEREWFAAGSLNGFMAAGPAAWRRNRDRVTELLTDPAHRPAVEPHLIPLAEVDLHLPFDVADYIDFYSSLEHASNAGRIFRPGTTPLSPNWRHMPVGYHGRAGTVVASGTPIVRPSGQYRPDPDADPVYGPSLKLDIEAEVGIVVGAPSAPARPVPPGAFREHVFGFVLVNDWTARDVQAWETRPLGPHLGKSFATSISPWVVPVAALEGARVPPPPQDPAPLPYLRCEEPWGLDLTLEIELNGHVISRPPFASMYWTAPQQVAQATANGAMLRTGDLLASGTVSGPRRDEWGSLMEIAWNGTEPIELPDGDKRTFLEDGDTVTIRATARGGVSMGTVSGTVIPGAPYAPPPAPGA